MNNETGLSQPLNLYDYLEVIKRYIWWGVIGFVVPFLAVVFYTLFWATPIYQAVALIEVEAPSPIFETSVISPKVEMHAQIIKSQTVIFNALQELGIVNPSISPAEREQFIVGFMSGFSTSTIPNTPLLEIKYTHTEPVQASRIVNAIARAYLAKLLKDKEQKTDSRSSFIEEQIKNVQQQVNTLERKLQDLKMSGQGPVKTEFMLNKLAELESSALTQSSKLGTQHPTVIALEEEIVQLKKQIGQLSPIDLVYYETVREKKLNEDLFNFLNTRLKELQIEQADKTIPLKVVNWALVPGEPFKPDKRLNLIIGAMLGLLIGFSAIFLRQALDLSLDTPEKIEDYLKLQVLVTLPRMKKLSQQKVLTDSSGVIAADSDEQNLVIEQLEQIGIKACSPEGTTLAIVGPIKGAGKTTLSIYYSLTAIANGKSVLLVDLDTRKPMVSQRFNLPREPGMTDILTKGTDWRSVIHSVPVRLDNPACADASLCMLDVITSGRGFSHPFRLFNSQRFDDFLADARKSYDVVILDTPPIIEMIEVAMICRKTNGYILVHKPGRLDRYLLSPFKLRILEELRDKCLGVILNQAPAQIGGYHYYDYYHRHYTAADKK
jgi:tyrosine-protein kinase Etk/Wzc